MAEAFQADTFQNDAFQTNGVTEKQSADTGSGADAKASGNPNAALTGSDVGYCGQVLEG